PASAANANDAGANPPPTQPDPNTVNVHGHGTSRRPLIVIGSDLVARFRNRLACRGIVVVASVNPPDARVWVHAERVGATYVIVLPTASSWLVHHLLRDLP
ncbi:hypothetical protein GA0070558_1791, partial [Micromonospora haikouensis]